MLYQQLTKEMKFPEAFNIWLSHLLIESNGQRTDASYIAPKTEQDYRVCGRALKKFFGLLTLEDIHPGHLMEYQNARAICDQTAANWAKPAGANCIRKEIALLIRILTAAGLWSDEKKRCFIRLRKVEKDVPRALTPDEQHRFLHLGASCADYRFVYCYTILGLQTTASAGELRKIRLGDVMMRDRFIQIRAKSAKNKYRIRTIPLVSEEVVWALEWLIERARELGSIMPNHCLFPFFSSKGAKYDPVRPMSESGLKKRWHEVRSAAALPWFKPNNLRHTALTRMAEAGTPVSVMMSFAGHISPRMTQHYTTISQQAKRGWAEAVWASPTPRPDPSQRFGPQSAPAAGPWQVRATREA